jgi:site-specific DNA-methyltransferase (adenine-specific)
MQPRKEIIGDAELWLGDCMEILPALHSIDAIITDPPYSARTHAKAKTNKSEAIDKKLVDFDSVSGEEFDLVVSGCLQSASGWVVMTCDYRHAARWYDAKQFVRLGAWVKPNPMPQITGDRPGQGFETVLILHSGDRPKSWNGGGRAGVWTFPVHSGAEVATQKPLPLIKRFVDDFTVPGETVADPFMGSGTTGVACVSSGRRFVGCEVNERHFDVACRRIEQASKQNDLFVPRPRGKALQASLI